MTATRIARTYAETLRAAADDAEAADHATTTREGHQPMTTSLDTPRTQQDGGMPVQGYALTIAATAGDPEFSADGAMFPMVTVVPHPNHVALSVTVPGVDEMEVRLQQHEVYSLLDTLRLVSGR